MRLRKRGLMFVMVFLIGMLSLAIAGITINTNNEVEIISIKTTSEFPFDVEVYDYTYDDDELNIWFNNSIIGTTNQSCFKPTQGKVRINNTPTSDSVSSVTYFEWDGTDRTSVFTKDTAKHWEWKPSTVKNCEDWALSNIILSMDGGQSLKEFKYSWGTGSTVIRIVIGGNIVLDTSNLEIAVKTTGGATTQIIKVDGTDTDMIAAIVRTPAIWAGAHIFSDIATDDSCAINETNDIYAKINCTAGEGQVEKIFDFYAESNYTFVTVTDTSGQGDLYYLFQHANGWDQVYTETGGVFQQVAGASTDLSNLTRGYFAVYNQGNAFNDVSVRFFNLSRVGTGNVSIDHGGEGVYVGAFIVGGGGNIVGNQEYVLGAHINQSEASNDIDNVNKSYVEWMEFPVLSNIITPGDSDLSKGAVYYFNDTVPDSNLTVLYSVPNANVSTPHTLLFSMFLGTKASVFFQIDADQCQFDYDEPNEDGSWDDQSFDGGPCVFDVVNVTNQTQPDHGMVHVQLSVTPTTATQQLKVSDAPLAPSGSEVITGTALVLLNGTNANRTITYPASNNASGVTNISSGNVTRLRINGTDISTPEIGVFPVGSRFYTYDLVTNATMNGANDTKVLNIQPGVGTVNINTNITTAQENVGVLTNCTNEPTLANVTLFRNGTIQTNNTAFSLTSPGAWNFTCSIQSSNYTHATAEQLIETSEIGLNITTVNASTNNLITFNVFIENETSTSYNESVVNNAILNWKNIPHGIVNISVNGTESDQERANYTSTLNTSALAKLNASVFKKDIGLFTINSPANDTVLSGSSFTPNITTPPFRSGDVNLSYSVDDAAFVEMCNNCGASTTNAVSLSTFGNHIIKFRARSNVNHYETVNRTLNVSNFLSNYNITILDEVTLLPFAVNETNSTTITVFCTNATETSVITSANNNIGATCAAKFIRVEADFDNDIYFRDQVVGSAAANLTFYMVNETSKPLGINLLETIIQLNDLTGTFSGSKLIVEKAINGSFQVINSRNFDLGDEVLLYLIKNDLYRASVDNGQELRVFDRDLVVSEEGTEELNIDEVKLTGNFTTLFDIIQYSINVSNVSSSGFPLIQLIYNDTVNRTNWVQFWVFNQSNKQQVLFFNSINNSGSFSFTWSNASINLNETYLGRLRINHQDYGIIPDQTFALTFYGVQKMPLPISDVWKNIFGSFLVAIMAMAFGPVHREIGMLITAGTILLLTNFGFLPIPMTLAIALASIAVLSIVALNRPRSVS